MTCFLGIDYGSKRIGLAVSGGGAIASPLDTLDVRGKLSEHVEAVIKRASEFDVEEFVVGLPLNMDDSEGEQAKVTRRFGEQLARRTGKTVHYFDERLTSREARETLRDAGMTRKKSKARIDRLAARSMLQSFLDSLPDDSA